MGHIKEPKGIDFVIESEPLTDKARKEISEFIRNYKKKDKKKTSIRTSKAIHT
jgi:hypothetical protein